MFALQCNVYVESKCNLHCKHCYYPKEGSMGVDMAFELSKWLQDLCETEQVKQFKMHILGGEPFLNPAAIVSLVGGLSRLPAHPDGKFVIFTNGKLLRTDTLEWCKFHHIRLLLNPTDQRLGWVNATMNEIKSKCGGVSLAVVADEINLPRLPELTKLALKYKGHIRINRLYDGGAIPGYVEEYKKQMHKVFDLLLASKWVMWPNFLLESTYPLWPNDKNPNACGRWLLIFDPNGDIRSCNADMETVIGNIKTHHRMSDFKFTHRWSAKDLPECKGCQWAVGGWCQGGCPYTRKLAFGTYQHKTPFCSAFKELFPRLKELVDKWILYNGEAHTEVN